MEKQWHARRQNNSGRQKNPAAKKTISTVYGIKANSIRTVFPNLFEPWIPQGI